MKVLEIYDGKEKSIIVNGKNVFTRMDNYFAKYPKDFRKLYDENLQDLTIFKVDEMYDSDMAGGYVFDDNIILFKDNYTLPHELIHMATNDRKNGHMAIINRFNQMERPLIEGLTEYSATIIGDQEIPNFYYFESFVAQMIYNIEGVLHAFFTANGEEFIKAFPNRKNIYSLMYALFHYSNNHLEVLETCQIDDLIISDIQDVIKNLLDIELSYENDQQKLKLYCEEFLDVLYSEYLNCYLGEIYPDYKNFAHNIVNKKIKVRTQKNKK